MACEHKPYPIKVSFWIRKSPALHAYSGLLQQMEGSRYRETNTCDPCCRFLLFNRFHWRVVRRQSPIWNCLNLFRRPDRKWRESRCERHDSCSQKRVTHQHSGRSVIVRINDRGPFVAGRVIDVTPAAARALGFSGLAPVTLDIIGRNG